MSRCLAFFNKDKTNKTQFLWLLLETGGAVASGFLGVAGVEVIILYPSGR
jgi:threonine synthase